MKRNEIKRLVQLLDKNSTKRTNYYNHKLLQEYKASLQYVRAQLKKLQKKFSGDSITYGEASQRLRNIEPQIIKNINKLNKNSTLIVSKGIKDLYEENFSMFNKIIGKALETKAPSFGLINTRSVNASVINKFDWVGAQTRYSNKLLQNIKSNITQGLISGKSYKTVVNNITNRFNVSVSNASRICRTELHRAESAARIDSIAEAQQIGESLGFKVAKIWSSFVGDGRTRQSHIDLDGTEADDNGMFNVGGILCEGPGMSGIAEEDIGCRCTITIGVT